MATIRLVPSTYAVSSASYLSVSSADNMYANTDSTTYATITNTNASTSSRYLYLRGFNFGDIPSNATINSFTVKIKGYESGLATSTSYAPRLANDTSAIANTTATSNFGTSTNTITIPTGSLTWQQIVNYGSDFTIMVYVRRNNRNTTGYFYCYGAEIEVNYTIPIYHTVTSSGDGNLNPSGSTTLLEGDSYTLTISGLSSKPTVTDNNVDVTSQVTESTEATTTVVPESNTNSGWYSTADITNAYTDVDSDTRATFQLAGGSSTGTVYLTLASPSIPSGATIKSVSCDVTLQYSRNNSSSGFTSSCQMYANNTAKGSATSWVTAGGTDVAKTTFHLSVGSWTASELANARFYLTATNNASSTRRYVYIYGVSFSITYESDGITYFYTINNVTGNHTIIVVAAGVSNKLYFKNNGSWVTAVKAYKKVNGSWVEQSDLSTVYDNTKSYVKGESLIVTASGTAYTRQTTASVSFDSSALTSGATYHVVGTGTARNFNAGLDAQSLVFDTNIVFPSSGSYVNLPYTYTGGEILSYVRVYATNVTCGYSISSVDGSFTVNLDFYST